MSSEQNPPKARAAASSAPAPAPAPVPAPAPAPLETTKFTRAAALWAALIVGFLVLIVLLIFVAQNTDPTPFRFLGWHWQLPLGVATLFAAVAGGLIAVAVAAIRMVQLHRTAKRDIRKLTG